MAPSERVVLDAYRAGDEEAFIACCETPETFAFLRKSWPPADFPGRGVGAAAIQTLVTTDRAGSGFDTALAVYWPTNHASIRIVQRAGFSPACDEQAALWLRRSFEPSGGSMA